ncbi:MAG: ATP-dependent exonuclease SbcCD, C subunit-like protein, partial [Candidatus Eremiobacteraeota bacterium]|nr:ATP-dependent exonuclease SbcCD, C subunit-like protein [Candidatus Eremiobacteraeota bacterium]
RHIGDRSQYVLGWTNEAKIAALEKQLADMRVRLLDTRRSIARSQTQRKATQTRLGNVAQLAAFESFHDLDWRPIAIEIDAAESERRELAEGSDVMRALEHQLEQAHATAERLDTELTQRQREESVAQDKRAQIQTVLSECEMVLGATPDEAKARYFPELEAMRDEALGAHSLTIESCDNRERDMRDWLQAKMDAGQKRSERLRDAIVRAMQEYRGRYPADARELDASVETAPGFRQLLERLSSDDLPRFEARFKELLNENAIREIANFQSQLNRELRTTAERIESINQSLHDIDYNPGRYILLEAERCSDLEIRDFQTDLRSCTEGTLTGSDDDGYAEGKFVQVRRIIERFRGREGTADLDRRWTRKVTDVRNWQVFSASERWREDDREHEHYTDSGGKSGGQKEKLAYTVLAASLAYQFGLARHERRTFRFVTIDEAFGRGSDESARYGLELFKTLDLQLLVVTPLQKIHVIEPFVANVAFVHNDGRESQIRNLTIEEYRARLAERTA